MEKPLNEFIQSAKGVRLSETARVRMRERLLSHIRLHPVAVPAPLPHHSLADTFHGLIALLRRPAVVLPLVLFIALGGMTVSAASGALPGEALYAFKVNVMEPLRGLTALSPEARAEWKVELAEERLAELEELAAQGRTISEETTKSQERFANSLEVAQETIQKLSEKNPDAATKLEARQEDIRSKAQGATTTDRGGAEGQENRNKDRGPANSR